MKRKTLSLLSIPMLALLFSGVSGCDKNDDNPAPAGDMYNINATMSSANEVPTNTSTATGTTTGTYNATNNLLTYNVTWTGLTGPATMAHFHSPALPGANANVLIHFNVPPNSPSGSLSGVATLTEAQETDLLAGKFYANIHTAANGAGEIRGQVAATR
jgi:hypothetical protein